MKIFEDLAKQGRTLVIVTHDPTIAKKAKRILNLKDGKLVPNHGVLAKSLWGNNKKSKKKK